MNDQQGNPQTTTINTSTIPDTRHMFPWKNLFWWGGFTGLIFAIGNLITYAFALAAVPPPAQPSIDSLNALWLARTPATIIAWTHMILYLILLIFAAAIYRAVPHNHRRLLAIATGAFAMDVLLMEIINAIALTIISPIAATAAHNPGSSMLWVALASTLTTINTNLGTSAGLLQVLALATAALGLRGVDNLPPYLPFLTLALAALHAIGIFTSSWRPAHLFIFLTYLLIICWIALLSFWLLSLSDPWARLIKTTGELPAVSHHSHTQQALRKP
jgi:hypothetical protein